MTMKGNFSTMAGGFSFCCEGFLSGVRKKRSLYASKQQIDQQDAFLTRESKMLWQLICIFAMKPGFHYHPTAYQDIDKRYFVII